MKLYLKLFLKISGLFSLLGKFVIISLFKRSLVLNCVILRRWIVKKEKKRGAGCQTILEMTMKEKKR